MPRASDKSREELQFPAISSPIFLKFNYDRNRESRKNNARYWSMLARKRQKENPC